MPTPLTLPLLAALAHLYAHNLTIDRLWTDHPPDGPPETHITTKPQSATPQLSGPTTGNVFEYQKTLPHCIICHKPKDKPGHATCLNVDCLRAYLLNK